MSTPAVGYGGELLLTSQAGQRTANYPTGPAPMLGATGAAMPAVRENGQGHHGDSPETGLKPPDTTGNIQCQSQSWAQMVRQPGATQVWPKVVTVTTTNRGSWPP